MHSPKYTGQGGTYGYVTMHNLMMPDMRQAAKTHQPGVTGPVKVGQKTGDMVGPMDTQQKDGKPGPVDNKQSGNTGGVDTKQSKSKTGDVKTGQ